MVKGVMTKNLEEMAQRGENLEALQDKNGPSLTHPFLQNCAEQVQRTSWSRVRISAHQLRRFGERCGGRTRRSVLCHRLRDARG